ncbi:MAG: TetR/AcrR family transcriptional regulator [Bacteroidota bacterium]
MPKIVAQKEDWIKLGYKRFAQKGEEGLVIESMAKVLKCNKSSFYWHFKTRKDFFNDLLAFWIEMETEGIIAQSNQLNTPEQRLQKLVELAFKKDPNIDFIFFLKRYPERKSYIRSLIDKIDQQRMAYVAQLLEELGHSKEAAIKKASIFYKYLIGYHEMLRNKKQSSSYVEDVLEELHHFIHL